MPGLEVAGEVVALGEGVTKFKLGDKVMSLVAGGGYAEYCLTHETHAMTAPKNFSIIEAGATCETLMTVWHNVFERGGTSTGRNIAGSWRLIGHRHHGDHDGEGAWRKSHRHGRLAGEGGCVSQARRGCRGQLQD